MATTMAVTAMARFEAKVDRSGGADSCWPWTASRFKTTGYGVFHPTKGKVVSAHRCLGVSDRRVKAVLIELRIPRRGPGRQRKAA